MQSGKNKKRASDGSLPFAILPVLVVAEEVAEGLDDEQVPHGAEESQTLHDPVHGVPWKMGKDWPQ
jgi:hypothetical protein